MQPAIQFEDISKRFVVRHDRSKSFQDFMINMFRRRRRGEDFWALQHVSFDVHSGETLGLLGQNGSGKSTALKLIGRILEPTSGKIKINGQISALIELGAGFHPDLTGSENIFLNGSLLGLDRSEMESRYDEIVEFSELQRFIDMPLRFYSSGMQMRLGFAVATAVDPDILLIDEVLAVGDEGFQRKCLNRINHFRGRDKAIVFVSHDLDSMRQLCDRIIWLENGVIRAEGPAQDVVAQYLMSVNEAEELAIAADAFEVGMVEDEIKRWGTGEVEILKVRLQSESGLERSLFDTEDGLSVDFEYCVRERIEKAVMGIAIYRDDGTYCYGTNTEIEDHKLALEPGHGRARIIIDRLALLAGVYSVDLAIHAPNGHPYDYWRQVCGFSVRSQVGDSGIYRPRHTWVIDGESCFS